MMAQSNGTGIVAEIKGDRLVVSLPMSAPAPSRTGRTLVVASSRGNRPTAATVDGKPVVVGLNAYIPRS